VLRELLGRRVDGGEVAGAVVEADGVVHVRVEKARRAIELRGERVEFFRGGRCAPRIASVSGVHAVLWELVAQASQGGGLERVDPMELTLSAAVPLTSVARLGAFSSAWAIAPRLRCSRGW
jgi:hypothetical protein